MHLTDIPTHLIDDVMSVDTLPDISLASAEVPSEAYMKKTLLTKKNR